MGHATGSDDVGGLPESMLEKKVKHPMKLIEIVIDTERYGMGNKREHTYTCEILPNGYIRVQHKHQLLGLFNTNRGHFPGQQCTYAGLDKLPDVLKDKLSEEFINNYDTVRKQNKSNVPD
jgi:hypothetical protein